VCRFDEIAGVQEDCGCHETWAWFDALTSAEVHGQGDDDSVEAGCGIHVK
jgi:hypothetical protein